MPDADIAIIGGGVSGLYAAWRLSTLPNPPRVALFESSARLGGRIDTAELPTPSPTAKAEFGAMRFLPSMKMVSSLLNFLGIDREPFPGTVLQQTYLRGVQIDAAGTNLPYQLAPGDPKDISGILLKIIDGAVPGAIGLNAQQWREVVQNAKFKDRELWRWGVQNVAEEFVSNEAYEYLDDAAGLDSALLSSNAALGLRCLVALLPDFATNQVFRPVNGFGSLIEALSSSVAACPSCSIHTRQQLLSLGRAGDRLTLNFAAPYEAPAMTTEPLLADKVIFALPRRAIELIDFGGLFPMGPSEWCTEFMAQLAGVHGVPAFKLCAVYDQPWWQAYKDATQAPRGWKNGYAVTDLPLRQVFFGLGLGSTQAGNERVLLATYADTRSAQYWSGLAQVTTSRLLRGTEGQFQEASAGNLTDAVDRQLRQLLQVDGPLPRPLSVGFVDWSADPFGGGWHEWNPGIDVTTAIPNMRHPIADTPVYVCGEAYSWFQSWIEGALMSAERMLQDHFQMQWPTEWLPQDYDLGP